MRRGLLACVLLAGCPKDDHAPALGVLPDAAASSSVAAPLPSPPPQRNLPCRAIAVIGKVTDEDGGTSLSLGGQLSDSVFTLDDNAKMTVKNPQSGREMTIEGPGAVRACVGGDPEHWLLRGGISAMPGSGEKPGAEEWVVTPFGIIRFASAFVKIRVEKDRATVRIGSGSASLYGPKVVMAPDAGGAVTITLGGWTDATPTAPLDLVSPGPPKGLVDTCAGLAKQAREVGSQIAQPDANLADLAPKHVEARRKARAACALARAATWGAGSGPDKTQGGDKALSTRAEAADAEWRIIAR